MHDVVVIGNINIETSIEASPIRNTEDYEVNSISERIGGHAIDICVMCSYFGLSPSIVSSIGMDASGLLSILEKSRIDYTHLIISETKTGKHIGISTPGDSSSLFFRGANKHLQSHNVDQGTLKNCKLIHLCPCNREIVRSIPQKARDNTVSCHFDISYSIEDLGPDIDILFVDSETLTNKTGVNDISAAGREITKVGIRNVVVFDSGRMIRVIRDEDEYGVSLDVDKAYDASEYSGSFFSGFIYRFIKTSNLKSSLSFGLAYQYFSHEEKNKLLFKDIDEIEDKMYSILRSNNE